MSARKIGIYELMELLGEGGIGQVYAARDTVLGRQVAIKMLRSELSRDRNFITRFYNEAQSLGDLSHANITTLHALHLEGREPFMVMELVHGRTLEALLERVHHLPLRDSLALVAQAVAGLGHAHRQGVIHRDIKPSNLMVTDSGVLKIMDFGIARVRGTQRLTRAGQMFGTLLYASPEQIRGNDVDERSDLYSLAVVLYEMLAGAPPFTAQNEHALMTAHLEAPPPPLTGRVRDLDPRIEPAVMRALAKAPEQRFASVEEFGRAVGAAAVRGDAADILQDYIASAFRSAPAPTRFINAPGAAANRRSANSDSRDLRGHGRGASPIGSRSNRLRAALQSPVAILGAVVVTLALGLGYVVWPKRAIELAPKLALVDMPKPQPPSAPRPDPAPPTGTTARVEPPKPAPQPAPQQSAATPVPPANQVPLFFPAPGSAPSEARRNAPVEPPAKTQTPVNLPQPPPPEKERPAAPWGPAPESPVVEPPQATHPQRPPVRLPEGEPDIQGPVSGVLAADAIRVNGKIVNLYGIVDHDQTNQRQVALHREAMEGYLQAANRYVVCYKKAADSFRCYADGNDLARLALLNGIAQPAKDAPAEYHSLVSQRRSAPR